MPRSRNMILNPAIALCVMAAVCAGSGCSSDSPTDRHHTYNHRESGGIALAAASPPIVLENAFGTIIITGSVDQNRVGWFMDETLTAESRDAADDLLEQVRLDSTTVGDTLFLRVEAPALVEAVVGLSLTVPNAGHCIVRRVEGAMSVSYLRAPLTTSHSAALTLVAHEGSCFIDTDQGDLTLEVALPPGGECRVLVRSGDILLRVPRATSAGVVLSALNGIIRTTGLDIAEVHAVPTHFEGVLHGGDGLINLQTLEGDITLRSIEP